MADWRSEVKQVEIEKRRWAVVSHLEKSKPTRQLSADILIMGCRASGIPTTAQEMTDTLVWLEQGLYIETETLGAMQTAKITPLGREVAQGIETRPGFTVFGLDG